MSEENADQVSITVGIDRERVETEPVDGLVAEATAAFSEAMRAAILLALGAHE